MSSSLLVPLNSVPKDISEVHVIVDAAFLEFDLTPPVVRLDTQSGESTNLLDKFVFVESDAKDNQCWLSFFEYTDASQKPGFDVTLSVETRGSWVFAGIVAYAFCKHAGYIVFNDSSKLDRQHTYTADGLRSVLQADGFSNCVGISDNGPSGQEN